MELLMMPSEGEILNILFRMLNEPEIFRTQERRTDNLFKEEQILIHQIYYSLDELKRNNLMFLIESTFADDVQIHVFLLSILFRFTLDTRLLNELLNIFIKDKLSINQMLFVAVQINRINFLNQDVDCYQLRREIHEIIVQKLDKNIFIEKPYIPLEKRNKNRIVITSGVLLGLSHAPSKILLDQCYMFQKELGMEVLLIISPVIIEKGNHMLWLQSFAPNYNKNYENSSFRISYRGIEILACQFRLCENNFLIYKEIVQKIYDFNPLFVYSLGALIGWEDILAKYTTVAAKEMTINFPVSQAPILFHDKNSTYKAKEKDLSYILNKGQIPLIYSIRPQLSEAKNCYSRDEFNLGKENFVIGIVGNRLMNEMNDEFKNFIYRILELYENVTIAIVGEFEMLLIKEELRNRFVYLGYQDDLVGIIRLFDLFLNPPRRGGGISALLALANDVPVLTFSDCDVAMNVGMDFVCKDYEEMNQAISKYLNESSFYEKQKAKGRDIIEKEYKAVSELYQQMVDDIKKTVLELEAM